MHSTKSMLTVLLLTLTLLGASGCATDLGLQKPPTTIKPGELFCAAYKPVPTDDATPEFVQRVIDDNNQACVTLGCAACSEKPASN